MNHKISLSTSIIDPFKPIPRELCIKEIANQFYNCGVSPIKIGQQFEPLSHKLYRYFAVHLYVVLTIRLTLVSYLYMTKSDEEIKENERFFIYLGDPFYFFPEIRIHWNLIFTIGLILVVLTHFLHSILSKNFRKNFSWMLLVLMLQGDVKPAVLGLFEDEDIKKLLKR